MKKVITYGSFDLFHEGHYNLLKRAKALGDYLIVGVTTEQYDEERGKIGVVDSIITRIDNVRNTGLADEVIIEDHSGQKLEDIQKYGVDIFTVGSDWIGVFDYLKEYCKVIYLDRTKGISSTQRRIEGVGIIRLGIIGNGSIAERMLPESRLVSGINAECVYNPKIESARRFADRFQMAKYTDSLKVLYDNSDAIYVASPHETHYDYVKDSILNGKHVFCEKPMAFKEEQAKELFELAANNNVVLLEALKTVYLPGFNKIVSTVKSGRIGVIRDVEACFTKLITDKTKREYIGPLAGSFTELSSYPLLAILSILGTEYKSIDFSTYIDERGTDVYTKAYMEYEHASATVKVGIGVKSEGQLLISGSNGYLLAESPWWLTRGYEIRYENFSMNEKFYTNFQGTGLRYELGAFVGKIRGRNKYDNLWKNEGSIVLAGIMERFFNRDKSKDKR